MSLAEPLEDSSSSSNLFCDKGSTWCHLKPTINLNASSAIIYRFPKICEQSVSVETTEMDVDFALNAKVKDSSGTITPSPKICEQSVSMDVDFELNKEVAYIIGTISRFPKICEQSVSVETSEFDVDSASHTGGITGFRNVSIIFLY